MKEVLLILTFNGVSLFLMFLYLRGRILKAVRPEMLLEEIHREVQQMILELNQTTDRNIGLVEDKMAMLQQLLSRTDKRLGLLKRELEKHEMSSQVYSNIVKKAPIPGETRETEKEAEQSTIKRSLREEVRELYRKGISPAVIAQKLDTTIGEVELIISLTQRRE